MLSSTADLIKGHVDVAATNGVHEGTRLALTAVLSHFPDPVLELELLGSGYNADLTKDEMGVFCTRTRRASESLSWRVPPSVSHSPPNDAREE
jgi:hypothetical protein